MRRSLRRVSRGHRLVGQQSGRRRGIEPAPAGGFLRQGFGRSPRPDGVAAAIWRCGGRYGPESGMSSPPAPVSIIEEGPKRPHPVLAASSWSCRRDRARSFQAYSWHRAVKRLATRRTRGVFKTEGCMAKKRGKIIQFAKFRETHRADDETHRADDDVRTSEERGANARS